MFFVCYMYSLLLRMRLPLCVLHVLIVVSANVPSFVSICTRSAPFSVAQRSVPAFGQF